VLAFGAIIGFGKKIALGKSGFKLTQYFWIYRCIWVPYDPEKSGP
jgi:hypothetical protein